MIALLLTHDRDLEKLKKKHQNIVMNLKCHHHFNGFFELQSAFDFRVIIYKRLYINPKTLIQIV